MSYQYFAMSDDTPPPLDDLSTREFDNALSEFTIAINEQYSSFGNDSYRVTFNGELKEEELTDALKSTLSQTNYDIASLHGESVVLFDKPYLVSEIYCTPNHATDKNTNVIRLLTNRFTDKKVIPFSHNTSRTSSDIDSYSVYIAIEVIWGFVLPRRSVFKFVRGIDLKDFFADDNKISAITKAHKNISFSANALKRAMEEQKAEVGRYLDEKTSIYNSLKHELNSILKEKERVEKIVANENKTLDRIRLDIKNETKELDKAQAQKNAYSDKAEELRSEIQFNGDKLKSEKAELNEISNLIMDAKNELSDLQDQITKAKADINVTTLDMQGFSSESKSQISKYFLLAMASIGFLAVVFTCMYDNAKTFSDLIDANPTVSSWNILLSRLPLITATTLIIGTLSALLFYLVNNIISVSEDKMNMLKASILAEQITGSLPKGDMTVEEIRDYKRNTKIELVMSIFTNNPERIKDDKQTDTLKQVVDIVKSLK